MLNFDENNKTVDIPDFVEDKSEESSSVDMSIFNMSDDELYDDDDKQDNDNKPKKKANSTIVLCLVVIGILLATTIASLFYAVSQHKELATANEQLVQLKAKNEDNETQIESLKTTVTTLTAQLEELQNGGTTADANNKYPSGTKLYITEDGHCQGVRVSADVDADTAQKNGGNYVLYWGDDVVLTNDATVDSNGNYWGKIDGGFIRIEYDGEIWATTDPQ